MDSIHGGNSDDDKSASSELQASSIQQLQSLTETSFLEKLEKACKVEQDVDAKQKGEEQNDILATLHSLLIIQSSPLSSSSSSTTTTTTTLPILSKSKNDIPNKEPSSINIIQLLRSGPSNGNNYGNSTQSNSQQLKDIHQQIRQIICIAISIHQMSDADDPDNATDVKWRSLAWESCALLFESCGHEWILQSPSSGNSSSSSYSSSSLDLDMKLQESTMNARTREKVGIGGTLLVLMQLCAAELRTQLSLVYALLVEEGEVANYKLNETKRQHISKIVSSCGRVMLAIISQLLLLGDALAYEEENDDPKAIAPWYDLPFDAVLVLKQSLDDAHDAMFQYLTEFVQVYSIPRSLLKLSKIIPNKNIDNKDNQITQLSLQVGLLCARGIGAWLSETEIIDIPSPPIEKIQEAIMNALELCHGVMLMMVKKDNPIPNSQLLMLLSSDSHPIFEEQLLMSHFIDLLPALVKLMDSANTETEFIADELLFSMEQYVFMGQCMYHFLMAVPTMVIQNPNHDDYQNKYTSAIYDNHYEKNYIEDEDDDTQQIIQSYLLLPLFSWCFEFFQQFNLFLQNHVDDDDDDDSSCSDSSKDMQDDEEKIEKKVKLLERISIFNKEDYWNEKITADTSKNISLALLTLSTSILNTISLLRKHLDVLMIVTKQSESKNHMRPTSAVSTTADKLDEEELILQLIRTLCDGVKCWFALFVNNDIFTKAEKQAFWENYQDCNDDNVSENNEEKPNILFANAFNTIFDNFVTKYYTYLPLFLEMLNETADCVYPHVSNNAKGETGDEVILVSDNVKESLRTWKS